MRCLLRYVAALLLVCSSTSGIANGSDASASSPERAPNASRRVQVLLPDLADAGIEMSAAQLVGAEFLVVPLKKESIAGGVLVHLDAPCAEFSLLVIATRSAVGSTRLDGRCKEPVRLPLVKRAELTVAASTRAGARVPRSGFVRAGACGGDAVHEIPFAVVRGTIRAGIPASCTEISLRVNGFAPMTLPRRAAANDALLDFGRITLQEGAASAFRVRSGADGKPVRGAKVIAVRAHELSAQRNELQVDRLTLATAVTDTDGWAHLSNLPQERVTFVVRAPGGRYPQMSEPYALRVGEETTIDDFVLDPVSSVFATLVLPEAIAKAIELRDVELLPAEHSHWPAHVPIRGTISNSEARIADVPPGLWRVSATGRLKNGFAFRLAEQQVEVVPGADSRVSLVVNDRLYQGRVTRDGAPVAGVINLKPAARRGGGRAAVATVGSDGTFQVLLAEHGLYSAALQESGGGGIKLSRYVDFDDPAEEIAIELPSSRIHGRVVDAKGLPVTTGVTILAAENGGAPVGSAFARSNADGTFVVQNVAAGSWNVIAESEGGRSADVVVPVADEDVQGVTLILDPVRSVPVRVVDTTGAPVREAYVAVEFPARGAADASYVLQTSSEGAAELRLSASQRAERINVVVATSDTRLSCTLRRLDSAQTISIPPAFGEVRLIRPRWRSSSGAVGWLLSSTGCAVGFLGGRVTREADGSEAMVLPQVAAGRWHYVETRGPMEREAVLTGRGLTLPFLKTFEVTAEMPAHVLLPAEQ